MFQKGKTVSHGGFQIPEGEILLPWSDYPYLGDSGSGSEEKYKQLVEEQTLLEGSRSTRNTVSFINYCLDSSKRYLYMVYEMYLPSSHGIPSFSPCFDERIDTNDQKKESLILAHDLRDADVWDGESTAAGYSMVA